MTLLKLFLDWIFLGIAQRRSSLKLAAELAATVAATAGGVAAEGLLDAAAIRTQALAEASVWKGGSYGGALGRY